MSKGAIVLSAVPSVVGATLGQMIEHDHDKNIIIYCGPSGSGVAGLTAMAYSTHTHGVPGITGDLSITSNSNAWSISIADFLTTAAQSDHTHSDLYIPLANSTDYATSVLDNTFLTTAPSLTHTHDYAGTGFTGTGANGTLDSNGLAIEIIGGTGGADGYNILAAGTQTAGTATTVMFANSNDISFGMSAGSRITASMSQSTHPHPYLSSISSTFFIASSDSTVFLTTAAESDHTHAYAGTQTSATNVGLTVDTDGISVSLDTSGISALGDGVNILAAGSQTAVSNGTVAFVNSNDFTFGMSDSTQITASFSQSTHDHPYLASESESNFQYTSATSLITSNAMNTSQEADYFYTSANTFANETHTHGSISTASTAGSDMAFTSSSSGLTIGVPQYITTQTSEPRVISINATSGELSLSGSRNVTVESLNGSTISIYGPANILNSFTIGGNTGTTNSSEITGGGFLIAGGDNVTLSQSNNTISIYGASGGIQLGNSDTTYTSGTVVVSGQANVTVNTTVNAGIQYLMLSADLSGTAGGADGYNILAAGTQTAVSAGTVSLADSNGISFGMSDNSVITASHNAYSNTSQLTNMFLTTGYTTHAHSYNYLEVGDGGLCCVNGRLIFSNSNGITFGVSTSAGNTDYTMTASVAQSSQSYQPIAFSGSNASITASTLSFGNANGLSFYVSNSSLVASYTVPTTMSQSTQPVYYAASGTTTSGSTVPFGNTNGVSFSLSNGSVVGTVATNYMASNMSSYFAKTGFTSSSTTGSLIDAIHNTDGLYMVVPRYLTTAMVSNAGSRFIGTATAQTNVTWTANSNGISLNAGAYARTGFTSTTVTGSVISGYHNTAGLYLSVPNFITTAVVSGYAGEGFSTGSTAGSVITGTLNSAGLSMRVPQWVNQTEMGNVYFTEGSNITWGSSSTSGTGGYSTSIFATAGTGGAGALSISAGAVSGTRDYLVFANSNSISFGMTGSTITASGDFAGGTGGGTSVAPYDYLSSSLNGSTLSLSVTGLMPLASTGSVIFNNTSCSNITFGSATTSNTTYIYATAGGGTGGVGALSISAGATSGTRDYLVFSNSNNVSFGMDGSTITGSIPNNSIYFSDGSNISFGSSTDTANNTTITASYAEASLLFSNDNGISFGTSISGSTTTVTAEHNAYSASSQLTATFLTTQSAQAFSASGGSSAFQTLNFANSNGITFSNTNASVRIAHGLQYTSNTSAITASALNTSIAYIRAMGNTASSNAFTSGSIMVSGSNLTVNTSLTGVSQYLQLVGPSMGYMYFSDISGFSWGSSTDGVSTSVYLVTA